MRLRFSVILTIILIPLFPLNAQNFNDDKSPEVLAAEIVDAMTDEELLGQILMLGYSGTTPSEETYNWIRNRHIGGVKVFGWNGTDPEQLAETIRQYQQKALESDRFGIPLLVATDQEGGNVRHITGSTTVTPGTMSLGSSGLPYDSYMTGYYIGQELRAVGVNMNFAPVVDLYNHPDGNFLGTRCFSEDPVQTGILGIAFYRGQQQAGIISTVKHFPGHGNTAVDSHGRLPVINASVEEFRENELVPFSMAIKEGIPAVMVGHISFPEVTGDHEPASISYRLQTEILKNELGFDGMIITDDMVMYGVRTVGGGIPNLCYKALQAGTDMLLVSRSEQTFHQVWEFLDGKMKEEPDFRTRVKDAAYRILLTKLRYLKDENSVPYNPNREEVVNLIPAPDSASFYLSQACRSVALIRPERIPVPEEYRGKVLLIGSYRTFMRIGQQRFPDADTYLFPMDPYAGESARAVRELAALAGKYDTLVFCLSDSSELPILESLRPYSDRLTVMAVSTPIFLKKVLWVESAIAVYGTIEQSYNAGFGALLGDFTPLGQVPIEALLPHSAD